MQSNLKKPNCFTQPQWEYYIKDVPIMKGDKMLDVCFDCTVQYQKQMTKEGKCDFPMKRLNKTVEYV